MQSLQYHDSAQMLMDPMGGIVMTSDGNAILREACVALAAGIAHKAQITVSHPAAKSLIEIARTQDEQVGDGTTSVVILGAAPGSVADAYPPQRARFWACRRRSWSSACTPP